MSASRERIEFDAMDEISVSAAPKTAKFSHVSLADQVRDALKDEIISGRLRPNDRIDINEYAQKWSISPTPLRDAVKHLETTGLVEIQPRRGVFVADLDRAGLAETFELRIAFEGMAARLAADRVPDQIARDTLERYVAAGRMSGVQREAQLEEIDDLIHNVVFDYCGNKRLRRMMESLLDLVFWSKQTIVRNVPVAYEVTLPEHIAICGAIVARDGEAAEKL